MNMIFISLFLNLIGSASAYIPPSYFILENIVKPRENAQPIQIEMVVKAFENDQDAGIEFNEIIRYFPKEKIVLSQASESGKSEVFFQAFRKILSGASKTPVTDFLLFSPDPQVLAWILKSYRVPIVDPQMFDGKESLEARRAKESLYLRKIEPAVLSWVIGSFAPPSAQLWVRKDAFRVDRFVFDASMVGGENTEIRFDDYRVLGGSVFPAKTALYISGTKVLEAQLIRWEPFSGGAPKAKDIKAEFTESGMDAGSSVKELMRYYYRYIR